MFTSATEYARFAIALMNAGALEGHQALSPSVVERMLGEYSEVPGAPGGPPSHYGYGLNVRLIDGHRMFQHGGERIGFGSLFRMIPDRRVAVIVLADRTGASLVQTFEAATRIALSLPTDVRTAPVRIAGTARPRLDQLPVPELDALTGRYANGGLRIDIVRQGGRVMMRGNGDEAAAVDRLPDGRYVAGGQPFTFVRGANTGRVYLFIAGRALAPATTAHR